MLVARACDHERCCRHKHDGDEEQDDAEADDAIRPESDARCMEGLHGEHALAVEIGRPKSSGGQQLGSTPVLEGVVGQDDEASCTDRDRYGERRGERHQERHGVAPLPATCEPDAS